LSAPRLRTGDFASTLRNDVVEPWAATLPFFLEQAIMFTSSTREVPESRDVPRHVAIIMDGNGRWAKKRFLPRVAGHHRGVETVRETVRSCIERGIQYLTLFAFSSENWRRPLHSHQIRLKVIGDTRAFGDAVHQLVQRAEALTQHNTRLTLSLAINYGGRWDLTQALNQLVLKHPERAGRYVETDIAPFLAASYAPEPDLFIRTGGEQRISNFLLWQLAYTELYFTDTLWPDFDAKVLDVAIGSYARRERRFGRTSEQLNTTVPGAKEMSSEREVPVVHGAHPVLRKPTAPTRA
jgi:undecaprenyl diphosphate synthase